jgi:putative ABC transport system permease protein
VAFILACPLAWYAISWWLGSFAFHVEINWLVFLIVGVVTLIMALLTISYRALQAAFTNPVNTLRHE